MFNGEAFQNKNLWELAGIIAPLNTAQAQVCEFFPLLPNATITTDISIVFVVTSHTRYWKTFTVFVALISCMTMLPNLKKEISTFKYNKIYENFIELPLCVWLHFLLIIIKINIQRAIKLSIYPWIYLKIQSRHNCNKGLVTWKHQNIHRLIFEFIYKQKVLLINII